MAARYRSRFQRVAHVEHGIDSGIAGDEDALAGHSFSGQAAGGQRRWGEMQAWRGARSPRGSSLPEMAARGRRCAIRPRRVPRECAGRRPPMRRRAWWWYRPAPTLCRAASAARIGSSCERMRAVDCASVCPACITSRSKSGVTWNAASTWSSMPRCCAVTQTLTENSPARCRMCSSTGHSLMASGRVPKTNSTFV